MLFLISSLSVSLLCVCLHYTMSSAYTSVHNLATHMCHLPHNCHLHSQWARLRRTKVACHIHVSLVPALTATRRSGILSFFISQEPFNAGDRVHLHWQRGIRLQTMCWKAPPAQVARATVGQFRLGNSEGDEGLHPSGRPKRTRSSSRREGWCRSP